MQYFKLITMLVVLVILSTCSNEYRIERKEDRLIGSWIFESASFRENGALFRENLDAEFEGDIIDFYGDYTADFDDRRDKIIYPGNWELILNRADFDNDNDTEFYLDMDFFDRGRPIMTYLCGVNNLGYERMNLRANTRGGIYFFRLRKL